jgi:hypothetical protein
MIKSATFAVGLAGLWFAGAALAQESVVACPSQEGLQAYLEAGEAPEDCREITVVEAGGGICSFDLGAGGDDDGLLSALAGAAVPTRWWALCGRLEEAAE